MIVPIIALIVSVTTEVPSEDIRCEAWLRDGAEVERRTLIESPPHNWSWSPKRDEFAVCNAPNHEPAVLRASDVTGQNASVNLRQGAPVRFTLEDARSGEPLLVVGLSDTLSPVAIWQVEDLADDLIVSPAVRYFRTYRRGTSPLTRRRQTREREVELYPVPRLGPGGEVVGLVPKQRFMPRAVEIVCRDVKLQADVVEDGLFSEPSIPDGDCAVTALYVGGVQRFPTVAVVKSGESTLVRNWATDRVGAATIAVERELCLANQSAAIRLHSSEDDGVMLAVPPGEACLHYAEGLSPGAYEAGLYTDQKPLATSVPLRVEPSEVTEVEIQAFPVRVTGTLSSAGEAIERVMFIEYFQGVDTWAAKTDSDGKYSIQLPRPGHFEISVRTTPYFPVARFVRELRVGDQTVDLELQGGSITLRAVDENGHKLQETSPIQFLMQGPEGAKAGFLRSDEEDLAFFGLALGHYSIRAYTITDRVSEEAVQVELTESSPHANREIKLVKTQGRLLVAGRDGKPLAGATVRAGTMILSELEPGSFSLARVPRGEVLLVWLPGYAPICKRIVASGDAQVVLEPGSFATRIILEPSLAARTVGSLSGLSGCEEPVFLPLIGARTEHRADGSLVDVSGLSAGNYAYIHPLLKEPVSITVPGATIEVRSP
ncbi:MAG TPA: hypothetical protein VGQ76_18945 [Thermoanaerobaculia bacterium]|jgi:hypothetical protein|nr:hypothetical protein [Thermoanaerobaculia bacterium]